MKFSVVIANWNYERFVGGSIQSVLAQDYPDIELILVDDGSTDSSREIIRRFESQAKVLLKPNGGQASALNYAFPHCTGNVVLFLDADDLLIPDALSKIAAAWRPGVSKLHFSLNVIDEVGHLLGARVPRARLPAGSLREDVLRRGIYISPPSSGNAYSREYLQSIMPIPEREWVYADAYLICQAPLWGEIAAVDEPLGQYRRHSRSATNVSTADPEELRRKLGVMFGMDLQIRRQLEHVAARKGLRMASAAVTGHWLHLKTGLALAKLERQGPGNTVGEAVRLVRAVWSAPEVSIKGRLQLTVWAMLVAALPRLAAMPLIQLAFSPGDRASLFSLRGWFSTGR